MKVNKLIKTILAVIILGLMLVSIFSFALLNSVQALTIDAVSIADEIKPGGTSRITISLNNNGDEDITDVSVVLDLSSVPFAPYNSASEFSIDEIREDKTKDAHFEIIALNNAKSGIYKIPLMITYIEEDKLKTKNSLISIVVDSQPIIDVSVDDGLVKYELVNYQYITEEGDEWDRTSFAKIVDTVEAGPVQGVVLVQIIEDQKLKFEAFPGKTEAEVSGFTEDAKIYER